VQPGAARSCVGPSCQEKGQLESASFRRWPSRLVALAGRTAVAGSRWGIEHSFAEGTRRQSFAVPIFGSACTLSSESCPGQFIWAEPCLQ